MQDAAEKVVAEAVQEAAVSPGPVRIAVIDGEDGHRSITFHGKHQIRSLAGCSDFGKIALDARLEPTFLYVTPNYFRQSVRWNLRKYDVVFNNVTDPDHNPLCLSVLQKLEAERGVPFLNSPRHIAPLSRERVASLAEGIAGLTVPKTLRLKKPDREHVARLAAARGFTWPGILRPVGTHGGIALTLVADETEAAAAMQPRRDHYLTEFVDFKSADGFYRKVRFFVIDGEVIVKDMVVGGAWNLHRRNRFDAPAGIDPVEEERQLLDGFDRGGYAGVRSMMLELASRTKLDFIGVDCAMQAPDRVVLFEANATMNFGGRRPDPKRPHKLTRLPLAIAATRRMIDRAATQGALRARAPASAKLRRPSARAI